MLISSNQDDDSIFKLIGKNKPSEKKAGKQGSHSKEKRKLILKYAIGVILYNPSAYGAPHIANIMEKINENIEKETLARKKILEEINRYIKHPNFIHWPDNSERLHGIILHKVFQLKDRCPADTEKFIELAANESEKLAFDLKLPHSIEEIKNILEQSKRLIKPTN